MNIFYDNGLLNKNKLREKWVKGNLPNEYILIKEFQKNNNLECKFSQVLYNYFNNIITLPLCVLCNNNKRFIGFKEGYNNFCSKKCAAKFSKEDSIIKRKENTILKYGVEHTSMLPEVKEKQKITNINTYGFISPTLNSEIREKQKNSMLYKYGTEFSGQNKELHNKSINTRFDNYVKSVKKNYPNLEITIIKESDFIIKCDICNNDYNIKGPLLNLRVNRYKINPCLVCNPLNSYKFTGQNDIVNFFIENNIEIFPNNRKILNGRELDIYIPSLNIAIEFNGLYWHSDLYKDKDYHLYKKDDCEKLGINLITIWEDDWIYKKDIVYSRLNNLINKNKKIYARKCIIKKIQNDSYLSFLNENHLQGQIYASYKIGLFYEDKLVAVMSFGKLRKALGKNSEENTWELYRYCSLLNTNVIGGFSKLINFFEKEIKPIEILTYANRDWTSIDNNLYKNNNFTFISKTNINYSYLIKNKRCYRFNFRKDILIKQGYDSNKTEKEIMNELGYNFIYDSGNLKFIKIIKN